MEISNTEIQSRKLWTEVKCDHSTGNQKIAQNPGPKMEMKPKTKMYLT